MERLSFFERADLLWAAADRLEADAASLQASVFTASLARAYRAVDELRTGTVLVNEGTAFWEQHPPFGGASRTGTGWGRIGGKYTILDMTDLRTAIIDTGRAG